MAYTVIDDPSAHFQVHGWTGNASTNAITLDGNSNLQADLYWHKQPEATNGWHNIDSSRGVTKILATQDSSATESTYSGYLTSFDSNGFTVPTGDSSSNANNTPQLSWLWKANGGTTSSNSDGGYTTSVQANQDAGFSIVTYSGTGGNSPSATTIGHGLGAVPKFIIIRARNRAENWHVFHHSMGTGGHILDNTSIFNNNSTLGATLPTSSVYTLGTDLRMNGGDNYVAWCFADVKGYSKFGHYKGNGSSNGIMVNTGFKPATIIIKNTEQTEPWIIYNTERSPSNPTNKKMSPGDAGAENLVSGQGDAAYNMIDILSNGFKLRSGNGASNVNDKTLIYAAWAKEPLVSSGGVPATAH